VVEHGVELDKTAASVTGDADVEQGVEELDAGKGEGVSEVQ
jgi:hypothetical protein